MTNREDRWELIEKTEMIQCKRSSAGETKIRFFTRYVHILSDRKPIEHVFFSPQKTHFLKKEVSSKSV